MESFLEKIAECLVREYPDKPGKIALVFPNRRAGLYLRKHLSAFLDQPVWLPQTFSIEDFVYTILGCQKAEHEFLLFELYHIHKNLKKEKAQSFQDFADWAETALRDFNDVDLCLADAAMLYTYIDEAKALQVWNPGKDYLTDFEIAYLDFFRSLGHYYKSLKEAQLSRNKLSQGMAYRMAAERIDSLIPAMEWEQIWFVGFNALNPAESHMLQSLTEAGKARLFFDIDRYYYDDPSQEAGKYLRDYLSNIPNDKITWIRDQLLTDEKTIEIIGLPQMIAQAKVSGQILSEIPPESHHKTAVVLGDENLLIPVIHSLPDQLGDFNVTMGIPLRLSYLNSLFESVFQLYRNAMIFSGKLNDGDNFLPGKLRFYHPDLEAFLMHPGLFSLSPGYKEAARLIRVSNRPFYSPDDIRDFLFKESTPDFDALKPVFVMDPGRPFGLLKGILDLVAVLKDNSKVKDDLSMEYLYHYAILFNRLLALNTEYQPDIDLKGLIALYRRVVSATKLPFYGEPLKGVQVMGMLETRNLDFEQVILLNVNEDIIPSGKTHNSFIPYDIRREYGLPTYHDNQAVYAYHFYHLLQHAKKIYLLYNTEPGKNAGGDKSRFIGQLLQEMPVKNPAIKITEKVLHLFPSTVDQQRIISIDKDEKIRAGIETLLTEKGLSASKLNAWLQCKLRFYFENIERLKESEEVEETMEAGTFGNAIHATLFSLYEPWLGKAIGQDAIKDMNSRIDETGMQCFAEALPDGDLLHGKNHLLVQTGLSLIRKLLKIENQRLRQDEKKDARVIIALEQKYTIESNGVKFTGIIDRIDKSGTHVEVLDYKTGNVDPAGLKYSSTDDFTLKKGTDKLFQLMFYLFLLEKTGHFKGFSMQAGIIPLKKLKPGTIFAGLPQEEAQLKPVLADFEQYLATIIADLRDESIPFSQTDNPDNCKYCSFVTICNR
jgi:CRISPR/Cas system-associated exonuclease Cas4 (RecB family)